MMQSNNVEEEKTHTKSMVEAWSLSSVFASIEGMVFFTKELQLFDLSC